MEKVDVMKEEEHNPDFSLLNDCFFQLVFNVSLTSFKPKNIL